MSPAEGLKAVRDIVKGSAKLRNLGVGDSVGADEIPPPWQDETGEAATLDV
jgi:hypothetical protein